MALKVIIVGGVAGGASAAARLRRMDEDAEIIIMEKGEHISIANCGLPYHVGDVIKDKDKLLVQTPSAMKKRFNLDVRVKNEVTHIDTDKQMIEVRDCVSGNLYFETYDRLILSPGAAPIRPNLPGIDNPRIFTLRNIPDTLRIKEYVDSSEAKSAVIIGAGYIGLEMAENLYLRGLKVTIVELSDHVMGVLDYDMAAYVHKYLKEKEIDLKLHSGVTAFSESDGGVIVHLPDDQYLTTDMVLMGIGVKPETELARNAGLKLGKTGGILVDAYMKTSDENIYAVGDAVETIDFINGDSAVFPLAGPANKQGRIAANNICGFKESYHGTQGTSIVKIFEMSVAVAGNSEKKLQRFGIAYEKSFTHSSSHATYYPGSEMMSIKLLFAKGTGKILGAQIVGGQGVDKRIDVLSTSMRAGFTVFDLEELELAYAPPFSSAKDPVNMAGYVAANILKKRCEVFHWNELETIDLDNSVLLDVRTEKEFKQGSLPVASNIPVDLMREKLDLIPKDKKIYVFCQIGLRGYVACRILKQKGFNDVVNLSGGYKTYRLIKEAY